MVASFLWSSGTGPRLPADSGHHDGPATATVVDHKPLADTTPVGDGFGIDRLSLSVPVAAVAAEDHWWTSRAVTAGRRSMSAVLRGVDPDHAVVVHQADRTPARDGDAVAPRRGPESRQARDDESGAAVMVGVMEMPQGGYWAKIEANPSRLLDPAGCSLCPIEAVPEVVDWLWATLREWVEPSCEVHEAKVKRLDLARDFEDVSMPAAYVRGLLNERRPYARRSFVYNDPARGAAETLFVGSGSGGVRLYDQHAAYAEKGAREGSVRWEAELRSGWLERQSLYTVEDLYSPDLLHSIAWDRWDWSRMGVAVTGTANVAQLVARLPREGLLASPGGRPSWAKADRLLGMLVREAFGVPGEASKNTVTEYRRMKRALGVLPTIDLFQADGLSVSTMARLDFATGREVVAAWRGDGCLNASWDDGGDGGS
ncbi:MAG: hypothetical protein QM595_07295 [Nocardioides sp.]